MPDTIPEPQVTQIKRSERHLYTDAIDTAFIAAMTNSGKLTEEVFNVQGFSGRKIRLFINNLIENTTNARYMEIGVFCGASFISALFKNKVTALGIDNWSWEGAKPQLLYKYLSELWTPENSISLLDTDFHALILVASEPPSTFCFTMDLTQNVTSMTA